MYIFEATYVDWDSTRRTVKVEVDSALYDTEKEIYIGAMKKALNLVHLGEYLVTLEFIAG